jgi:putative endopeptidase
MATVKKRTNKNSKTRKRISTIAKIEENSFPTGKHPQKIQIAELYDKSELIKSSGHGKKRLENKDINKVLKDKLFHIFYILDKQDISFQPNKDFYTYSNMLWLNNAKKDKSLRYFTQFDNFRITQDKVYYKLILYVNDYIKQHKTTALAKKMSNVLKSWSQLNSKSIQRHVDTMVTKIDEYRKDPANIWSFLAHISKDDLIKHSNPLNWVLQPDQKNSKVYTNYITSCQFGLYDIDVYFQTKPKHKTDKANYIAYIDKIFNLCLGRGHGLRASDVFDTELQIINAYGCVELKNNHPQYNLVATRDALAKYGFDWHAYASALGYEKTPPNFVTPNLNYLQCISKILVDEWNNEKWRTYWIFIHLTQMVRFHKKWRVVYFNYYEKSLAGQTLMFPDDIYPIFGLSITFNTFLTKKYIEENYRDDYVEYAKRMAENIRHIFITRVETNDWLSPKTMKYAIEKLKAIKLVIAAPSQLREDPLLDYKADDAWGNMQLIFEWRNKQFLQLYNKPIVDVPEVDWKKFKLVGTQAYVVNAYYMPIFNSIYVPLGYLQKPFIDLEDRGIEYNLAYLGFTMAHEFSHSLDETGSQYDIDGNLHDWWSPKDKIVYKKRIKDIDNQYTKFMGNDGLKGDVTLYTGENMADITGLTLCAEYLVLYHSIKNNMEGIALTFLSFKLFFNFFASQMRQHLSQKAFDMQMKTNPHPLDKYRTNCPLARIQIFKKVYRIQEKDPMFWPASPPIW